MTTSRASTNAKTPEAAKVLPAAKAELGYGARFLSRESLRILLRLPADRACRCRASPAWSTNCAKDGGFFFDQPILLFLHQLATPGVELLFVRFRSWATRRRAARGRVHPRLAGLRRRYRDALFFGLAVVGSLLVNLGVKSHFARLAPGAVGLDLAGDDLQLPQRPRHGLGDARHRGRAAAVADALALVGGCPRLLFVLLVGMSRVYLGVHFPSDILAGWTGRDRLGARHAWLVASRAPPPPSPAVAPARTTHLGFEIAQQATDRRSGGGMRLPGSSASRRVRRTCNFRLRWAASRNKLLDRPAVRVPHPQACVPGAQAPQAAGRPRPGAEQYVGR
jgi:undecaprenyl-diphosphatase